MSRSLAALWLSCLACSGSDTRPAPAPPSRAIVLAEIGLALEVPADWSAETNGHVTVIAGPEGSDAYFTPIVVQTVVAEPVEAPEVGPPEGPSQLLDVLRRAYSHATAITEPRWGEHAPTVVADRLALSYEVRFELFEKQRRRVGVLIDLPPYVVDVSYAGPEELFMAQLPSYLDAVASLTIEP